MSASGAATAASGWALGVRDGFRLARRVILAFWLLSGSGTLVIALVVLAIDRTSSNAPMMLMAFGLALVGIALGQLVALARLRVATFVTFWTLGFFAGIFVLASADAGGDSSAVFAFLTMGALSGYFSLQHRFELVAVFWATVCWIGSIIALLNHEGRVAQWHANKLSAWLPVTLLILGGYLAATLLYLLAKHSYRLALWQVTATPAPPPGRVAAPDVALLSRRNWLPVLALAAILFVFTATVSPLLWRTARGENGGTTEKASDKDGDFGSAIERALRQLEQAAERSIPLWLVILLSLLANRPLRRAIYVQRLRRPIERVAPTRRVEQLWRYVLVAAGDVGIQPGAADSPRDILGRVDAAGHATPEIAEAVTVYERARFGLGLPAGDAQRMEKLADAGFAQLRLRLTLWQRMRSWYRKLS